MAESAIPVKTQHPTHPISTLQSKKREEALAGLLFIAPAMLIFIFFLIIPVLIAFYLSFTNWNGITPLRQEGAFETIGTENYQQLLTQDTRRRERFFIAVKNTTYYVIGVVPTQTLIALVLAIIVNQRWLKGRGYFRTIFYFPSITSSVVVSIIFMWLFSQGGLINAGIELFYPNYDKINWIDDSSGVFHWILSLFGINRQSAGDWTGEEFLGIRLWNWISGPSVTMFMIMILNTWTTIGTMMVIFLAALQNIPSFVYEAAQIDGANVWQVFRKITVPLLRPTTFFVITLGLIGTFQVFDQVYVIGGDDSTLTIAVLVHDFAFDGSNMGLATATAMILFVIIFVFTMIQRRFMGGEKGEM